MRHLQYRQKVNLFIAPYGQQDNLGDSVLRRGLLNGIRGDDITLHIYLGDNSPDFSSGLGIQPRDLVYNDRSKWNRALVRHAIDGSASYLFNSGESGAKNKYVSLGTFALLGLVRVRGGAVIHSGIGLRHPELVSRRSLRLAMRFCTFVSWRDARSQQVAGRGIIEPDWAFNLVGDTPTDSTTPRAWAAISLRGDRPQPQPDWYLAVRGFLEQQGLKPIVVSQVRRDNQRAAEISSALDCPADLWNGEANHAVRERQVRSVYGKSAVVISDRLHALVMGATEGAQPVGYVPGSTEKIRRTLEPAGWLDCCFSADELSFDDATEQMARQLNAGNAWRLTSDARRELLKLQHTIRESLHTAQPRIAS